MLLLVSLDFWTKREREIIIMPNPKLGLECFVNADFAGGWSQANANNTENVTSWTKFLIRYVCFPIGWCSKLQTKAAFSIVESEYIVLLWIFRIVIPLVTLVQKLCKIFSLYIGEPDYFCKVCEDNQSCTESTKLTLRTKHSLK